MPKDQLLFELKSQRWMLGVLVVIATCILFALQKLSYIPIFPFPHGIWFMLPVFIFLLYELYAFWMRPSYFRIDQSSIRLQSRLARWRNAPGLVWMHAGGLQYKTEWIMRPSFQGTPKKSALWLEVTDKLGKHNSFYLSNVDFDSRWLDQIVSWIKTSKV